MNKVRPTNKADIFPAFIRKLLLSWLFAVTVEYWLIPDGFKNLENLSGIAEMSLLRVLTVTVSVTALLSALSYFFDTKKFERWGLVGIFSILSVSTLIFSFSWTYFIACILIVFALAVYALKGWNSSDEPEPELKKEQTEHKRYFWITFAFSVGIFIGLSVWGICRIYSFCTPTFDCGIFSQMFYYLKETGLPFTTIERASLLSHFAVHISPIYYLMLPFYMIFPNPVILPVLQAAVIVSAVIPVWKLAKLHGASGLQRMILCIAVMFLPAFTGGIGYDFHENCFLLPLVFWMFYGIDRKSIAITVVASLLTLCVKEDAAVYVAVMGLFLILKSLLKFRRSKLFDLCVGIGLLIVSVAWFVFCIHYLSTEGDGIMTHRYFNFIYDGSKSLSPVIKTVILNPMKALFECVDKSKLEYIALTILPLSALSFFTRRYERFVLFVPYLLVNLMPDYMYQHDIFFQYSFGSVALLVYLAFINCSEIKLNWKKTSCLLAAAAISFTCFSATVVPKAMRYPLKCIRNNREYISVRQTLSEIPEEASVVSTTLYTTALSQRKVLYDLNYCKKDQLLNADYVVLTTEATGEYESFEKKWGLGFEALTELLEENGFEITSSVPDKLVIYGKNA